MRIVIADDEQWVRAALKEMLPEADFDVEIVGEAADGGRMAELVEEKKPDIAFVDIRMPQMNGLEGIAAAKEKSPDTMWVILSGYSDFQYAQQAIRLGVEEYLLKPVSPEKLRETLVNVKKRKYVEKANRNTDFQNWLISSFYMGNRSVSNKEFSDLWMIGLLLCFDTWVEPQERDDYQKRTAELMERRMEEPEKYGNVYRALFVSGEGKMTLAAGVTPGTDKSRKAEIRDWFYSLQKELSKISDIHCILTGICTGWRKNAAEMFACFHAEEELGYCRITAGPDRIWSMEELEKAGKAMSSCKRNMCRRLALVAEGMRKGSYLHFIDCVVRAEEEWIGCRPQATDTEHANMKRYLAVTTGISRFLTREEFRKMELGEALLLIREKAREVLARGKTKEREEDVVKLAEDYIRGHYGEDISVAQIAEQLSLTPNYLSALFHKKTGTTFVKYLTRVRMLEAERLLQNTSLPVWRVAEATGFSDTRYFTKIFKDYFGILPSEYGS